MVLVIGGNVRVLASIINTFFPPLDHVARADTSVRPTSVGGRRLENSSFYGGELGTLLLQPSFVNSLKQRENCSVSMPANMLVPLYRPFMPFLVPILTISCVFVAT